jgi:hypothetical protein
MNLKDHKMIDEVPFLCLWDRDDILEEEKFEISDLRIICKVSSREGVCRKKVDICGKGVKEITFTPVENERP